MILSDQLRQNRGDDNDLPNVGAAEASRRRRSGRQYRGALMHRFNDALRYLCGGLPGRQTTRSPVTSERIVRRILHGEPRRQQTHTHAYQNA